MNAMPYAGSREHTVDFAACRLTPGARARALEAMASGWLTAGPRTAEFEKEFGEWVGARHTVAVSSCTAALELSLRALGLPAGAPVFTPTLTFAGAVHAIVHSGLRPVLIDADEATLTVNQRAVATAARRERPAAMVVQHMAGYPIDVEGLADAAGLPMSRVVEDAAHGLGARSDDRQIGTLSAATCFSFYATKNLPIGEGGAITTADGELADRLRVTRQHGMSKDAWRRYEPGASWRYRVEEAGLKANFTDLQAALGLGQLPHLTAWQSRRSALAARYDERLAEIPGIVVPPRPLAGRHAWHLYIVRVGPDFGLTRDALAAHLQARGVGTSVHFIPVHQFGYFRSALAIEDGEFPVADRLADELLSLPMHPHLSDLDIDVVCSQISEAREMGGNRR